MTSVDVLGADDDRPDIEEGESLARRWARRSCAAQGVPEQVEDPEIIRRAKQLMHAARSR